MKGFIFLQTPSSGEMLGKLISYYVGGNFILYLILLGIKGNKKEAWRMITTKLWLQIIAFILALIIANINAVNNP